MGKRGGSPQVVQQAASPWGPQVPHIGQLYATAKHLSSEGNRATFYPGRTVAEFAPEEYEALRRGGERAMNGSQSTNMARDYARGILNNDPRTLATVLGPRVGELLPQLQSQFNRAGMGASSLARSAEQELIARELSKLKESAADRLERLGPQEYNDIARLAAIGETQRDMRQSEIDEQVRRHEYAQQEPWERLRNYQAAVLGHFNPTESSQRSMPMQGSRLSGALGGALGGASAGSQFGPWGAGIGGVLGGLGGLF